MRELASMLDEFRASVTEKTTEEGVNEHLKGFIEKALGIIDTTLFPSKKVELTFMREGENKRLRIIGVYPPSKEYDANFYLDIDDKLGYARLAYAEGRTVYVPSVKRDWGIQMTLARRPGELPRKKGVHRNLWKESTRRDFGTLICAPTMVVKDYHAFTFDSYGVLNIEHTRRVFTGVFNAQDLYCACLAAGVLGNAIAIATAQLTKTTKK